MFIDSQNQTTSAQRSGGKFLGVILLLAVLTGGVYLWIWPGSDAPQQFVVNRGDSARTIARALREARLIGSRWAFLAWVKLGGATPRPGVYTVKPAWSGYKTSRQLRSGPPLERVTFPEGWTSRQMAALLDSRGVTSGREFEALVAKDKREGFLFPDTYFFDQGLPAQRVIDRMIQRFHEAEPKDMIAQAKALGLSYRELVTLASLVEKEARAPEERPVIAGVFLNRLKKRWRLESCATVQYALGDWKKRLIYKDLEVNSPYNTYKHPGLPPGPICNPGKAALEAAAHPTPTDMMFFVADGNGTHRFSKYYKDHIAAQKQRKKS